MALFLEAMQYDPYQNAVAEGVHAIIKQEFLNGIIITDIKLMKKIVVESIDIYNEERLYLSCQHKRCTKS